FASAAQLDMFEAEFAGLGDLAHAGAVRVPQPICAGRDAGRAWLVLEYLDLRAGGDGGWRRLGAALASQHRRLAARFGWGRDNTIGSTPQPNAWSTDWIAFLRERRLGHQLRLAEANGFGRELADRGARLLDCLPAFFAGYTPQPSLLHGDLWSGNVAFLPGGEPVIFDPAVYYGDREADLAMTELFGAFGGDFYAAYAAAWSPEAGYPIRKRLYNLYHLLNHLNLFGAGYLGECRATIDWLLARA
ncbi:MAG: fructosamine kinase family protein, partial [Burkholderiales bacterium]